MSASDTGVGHNMPPPYECLCFLRTTVFHISSQISQGCLHFDLVDYYALVGLSLFFCSLILLDMKNIIDQEIIF